MPTTLSLKQFLHIRKKFFDAEKLSRLLELYRSLDEFTDTENIRRIVSDVNGAQVANELRDVVQENYTTYEAFKDDAQEWISFHSPRPTWEPESVQKARQQQEETVRHRVENANKRRKFTNGQEVISQSSGRGTIVDISRYQTRRDKSSSIWYIVTFNGKNKEMKEEGLTAAQ